MRALAEPACAPGKRIRLLLTREAPIRDRRLRWFFRFSLTGGWSKPRASEALAAIQERPPDRLNEGEEAKLVTLPESYGFVIRFALGTGLRWCELCRAQASHIERAVLGLARLRRARFGALHSRPMFSGSVRQESERLVRSPRRAWADSRDHAAVCPPLG